MNQNRHDGLGFTRIIPEDTSGGLWKSQLGPCVGVFEFRGRSVRISVQTCDVLFPTDCGLCLIDAWDHDTITLEGRSILDVGTGSGVYAMAALVAGAAHVTALDVNPACGEVVLANAKINRLDSSRLEIITGDIRDFKAHMLYDIVVSNPPHFPWHVSYDAGGSAVSQHGILHAEGSFWS